MSASDDEFIRWMCLDQSCCLALVVLGFFTGVPMGFICFPRLQLAYIITSVTVCILMTACLMKIPDYQWEKRAFVIILGTGIGYVVPAAHFLVASAPGRAAIGGMFSAQIALTGIAVIFYVRYYPERFAPGKFDLWGNSHQLWHIAIYASIALYGECLIVVWKLIDDGAFC